jgi:hypothetical protein
MIRCEECKEWYHGKCVKVTLQFEKWKDRRLSLRHKVLIINTYILSKILYVARIVPPSAKHIQIINRYIYTIFWGMPLILSLHLILDASVSIIRAYSDILREHPCLIDLVIGTMFVSKPFT